MTAIGCNGTLKWSTEETTSSIEVSTSGTYSVSCTTSCGTAESTEPVVIRTGESPKTPLIEANVTKICGPEKAKLTASNCNGEVIWSNGMTGTSIEVGTVGTYSAICRTICADSPASNVIEIKKGDKPAAPVLDPLTSTLCEDQTVTLTASGCTGGTITWSNGSTGSILVVSTTGTYSAFCITICGTSDVSNVVTINKGDAPAKPTLTSDKLTLCGDEKAELTVSGCNGSISWEPTALGTSTIIKVGVGSYTAICTTSCGTSSATIEIKAGEQPKVPVIDASKKICCDGEKATLTAIGCNGTLKWSTGETTSSIEVSTSGTYSVSCTTSCGTAESTEPVVIRTGESPKTPLIEANVTKICGPEKAKLTASNCNGEVIWSNGMTGTSIEVSTVGTYSATCKTICAESPASNVIEIKKGDKPEAPVLSPLTSTLCEGQTVTLTASGCTGGTITWSNGSTGSSLLVSTTGTYSATCTTACGESVASNVATITSIKKPDAPKIATTDKPELCGDATATLTASNCTGTIKWSTQATTSSITVSVAGTYTAICFNACGESEVSNPIVITKGITPTTPTVLALPSNICEGASSTLTASGCLGTVVWSNTTTGASIVVSEAGTYTAKCVTSCGTSEASNAVTITVTKKPDAPTIATTDNELCNNETATLTATGCNANIKWSNGSTGSSIVVSIAGTYTATCSNTCGTSVASNVISITKDKTPDAPTIATTDNELCNNETAILTATGCNANIKWSNGSTGSSIVVSTAGTYSATCSNTCGTSVASNVISITKDKTPDAPTIATTDNELCNNETAILTATGCNANIKWSNGSTGSSIVVSTAGTYSATCSNTCGTSVASNVISITKDKTPDAPTIATTDTELCNNETATLTATGCTTTIKWSNGSTGSSIVVSTAGTYSATCSNTCGTSVASNVISITKDKTPDAPTIATTDKTELCNNETATLTATGCTTTIKWSNGSTGSSIVVSTAGTYTATCSNTCGTSVASNVISITKDKTPDAPIIATTDNELCNNETATLTATGCTTTIKWSNGSTGSSIVVSTAGTYSATCSNTCGTSVASNVISITKDKTPDAPTIATTDNELCNNETATLTATGCTTTIKWSNGSTGSSIVVSTAGTYSATCSNTCGTSGNSNAVIIKTGTAPVAPQVSASKPSLCPNETSTLTATGCVGSLKWSTGATTSTITVSVAGTYSASCENTCGSAQSNEVVINTLSKPTAPIISTDKQKLCGTETATLTAVGCTGTITWNVGGTGSTRVVSSPGTYTATCTNACGVSGASNILTIFDGGSPTAPQVATNKNELCGTEVATLTATGCSGTVKWSNGSTGSSITVGSAGTYTAVCTNNCGTSGNSNAVIIKTGTAPVAPQVSASKPSLCPNETSTLTATGCVGSLKWSTGATTSTITVSVAGTYSASCENTCGSAQSNEVVINTLSKPTAPIISTDKQKLCGTETATLTAVGCTGTITWNVGGTGSTRVVSSPGTYTATCTNACGVSGASNILTIFDGGSPTAPQVATNKTELCGTEVATLTATGCSGTVKWSNGSTGSSITVGSAGTYTAVCTNNCGTSGNSNAVIIKTGTAPVAPQVSASKPSLCPNETSTLTATGCVGSLKWSTGATTSTITVSVAGTYSASCENTCGSAQSNEVVINTLSKPTAPIISTDKQKLCGTETATLTAVGCTGTITWNVGGTGSTRVVSSPGTYTATCTNACGVSGASNILTIFDGGSPTAPQVATNKTELCGTEVATLTATGCSGTVKWSNGSTGSSITVGSAGTYTAVCTNNCGTSGNSNAVIIKTGTAPVAPQVSASKPSLCPNETSTLTATGCVGSLKWSTGATTSTITVSVAGTYSASCENTCGSAQSNEVVINTLSKPTAPIISTDKQKLCGTETATLTAVGCTGTITWNVGGTGSTRVVSSPGTYTATCTNACGVSGASNILTIFDGGSPTAPQVATNKTELCGTDVATLTATGCSGTVKWSNGSTGSSITVGSAGTYTAVCTNNCGTSGNSNAVIIKTGTAPAAPTIVSDKTTVCSNETARLTATGCIGTVSWSTGSTGSSIVVSNAGTYSAKCVSSCGESVASNTITITSAPTPTVPVVATNTNVICGTEKATLTATGCNGTIKWSTGATTSSISVSVGGTYTAMCINACSESDPSAGVVIKKNTTPTPPVVTSNKTSLCGDETATLTATGCGGTVKWSNTATGSSITVSVAGTFTAVCISSCGTSLASNAVIITTGATPSAPTVTASKTSLCGTETATLTANGCGGTVKWSTGSTSSSITVSTAGTYTATCTNACGNSGNSTPLVITTGVNPTAPTIAADKLSLCGNETATLTATGCTGTLKWSTNATTPGITVSTAGTYTAVCVNACGTSATSNVLVITKGGTPSAPTISADKMSLCGVEKATLTASGCGGTVKWSNGSTGSSIMVGTAGTYTATCTTACGTSGNSNAVIITTGGTPSAPMITSDKASLCGEEKATLTATACGGTVKWSNGSTGSSITVGTAGTYTAICTTACGTSGNSNAVVITTGGIPTPPTIVTDKTSLCGTETAKLTAYGCSGTVTWSNGSTGSSITVNTAGTYTATCTTVCGTSGHCSAITITKDGTPSAPTVASDKTSLCGNETATLTANGCGGTIKWSNGSTGSSIIVGTAGTYTATCTTACGTSGNSNAVIITTGGTPSAPTIASDKTSICGTETATLTANGCGGTIKWSNGSTGSIITVGTAGTYTAICTTACGTSGNSNAVIITTGGTPSAPTIASNKTSLCGNETATLTANGCGGTIKWSNGSTGTSITVGTAGTYTATCTTTCGTSGNSNAVIITSGGTPSAPTVASTKPSICGTETAILTATGCGGTIKWSNGSTGSSITVGTAGTYTATCTTACGTSGNSNAVIITTGGTPSAPTIASDKTSLCGNETATLTANGCGGTIKWSNGSTGTSITVGTAGTYTATCTTACGTSGNSNAVIITTGGTPSAPTVASNKTSICGTETATLTATGCGGTVNWSNGSTGSNITVGTAGTYTAICVTACGTSAASETITITQGSMPIAPIIAANKTSICANETAILTASGCSGTITWTGGSTGTILTVSNGGTYAATCINGCGSSGASNSIVITTKTDCGTCNTVAPVIATNKTSICKPENVNLTATGCSTGVVIWSTGQTGSSITVKPTATTLYTAVCKESNVCSSALSNQVQVKVSSVILPSLVCLKDFVCDGESVTIKASGCEGVVVWSTGATGESLTLVPDSTVKYTAKCKVGECESGVTEPVMIPYGKPNKPFIHCKKQICVGESTTLSATGCSGLVVWSTGATGAVLTVTPTQEFTTYWAKCQSLGGKCESERSNEVTVTVGKSATAPTVIAEIKNVCPFNTADLNTAILTEISTVGGQFEFHTTNSVTSPLVTNPGAVGAGTYYVFERTSAGCYSAGSVIKVSITTCDGGVTPGTPTVDLAISKKASADKVEMNQEVEYKVSVRNVGTLKATGIEVRDILPYKLSFVSASANATYNNGIVNLKLDSLLAGDSVTFTYKTKVVAGGKIVNKAELSKVNEVDNTTANNVSEYTINNPANEEVMLGMSKVSGEAVLISEKTYTIPFTIYVRNMGNADVTGVQVVDDLEKAFGNGAKILNDTVSIVADSGLVVNPNYTGRGQHKNMLIDSLSTIKKGATSKLSFNVRVDVSEATSDKFYNKAELSLNGEKKEESTDGVDPDPDNDGDPTNNNDPTPIEVIIDLNPNQPAIGVSLAIVDSTRLGETSYSVTYMALVKNVGNAKLTNVQVSDSLNNTFADSASYVMIGTPTTGLNSTLKLNPNFNGKEDANLLIADTTSQLTVSKTDSIFYTVQVFHNGHRGPYQSNVYAKAIGNGQLVTDKSNEGLEVKANQSSPTVLELPVGEDVMIPGAFSPNDDGANDYFKVKVPTGAKLLSGSIYNRWGHLVFKDKDNILAGENSKGWDGTSNQGVRFGSEGLPDGTYFYAIDYEVNGKKVHKVGYITLAR
ncbi:T9SS type B sorting domain-containing protein [Emticicia soli]|uniref:Gliding motility-associated C-terminal domain-containing protein n=1 Tax=Emticicia soli TaxID=2027878 RepID=A0ABW5JE82_9BACT